MRAAVADARPQIPAPGPGWVFPYGASASGGEALLPAVNSEARSPLVPVYPSTRAQISGEALVPPGGDGRTYFGTIYAAADRITTAPNVAGNDGNGSAPIVSVVGEWAPFAWVVDLGPEIHWMRFYVRVNAAYGTPGTRYRNLRLTLTR